MADKLPGIQPTPQRIPGLVNLARVLQSVDQFARAPFGYSNPPAEILSDVFRVPELYRTIENVAYGSPLTRGTGQARAMTPDTKGAAEALMNLAPAAPALTRATMETARAAAPYAARNLVRMAEKYGVSPTMNIIKPKGGNWLSGSVEEAVRPLKSPTIAGETPAQRIPRHEALLQDPSLNADQLDRVRYQLDLSRNEAAIDRWLDTKLSKYIRNEMGTEEDPILELAAKGVTHVPNKEDLMMSADWIPEETARGRRLGGYPEDPTHLMVHAERGYPSDEEELARLAAGWENAADSAIRPQRARDLSTTGLAEGNQWLEKVDPETMVYQADRDMGRYGELGFPHLVDELKNAMRPDSGLPQNLRLDPNKIDKVTVPQAVELVSKINAWRAEQKIAANAEKANNAATVVHKEYPEQGYKWVEIKPSSTLNPEYEVKRVQGKNGVYFTVGKPGEVYPHTTATEEEALKASNRAALEEALKYEGDVMGHCVGGYCPDVMEGRSRIFSLRDKKGEPHVTIEVKPGQGGTYTNDFRHWAGQEGYDLSNPEDLAHAKATFAAESSPQSSIIQIKGKANKKPKDEYLPFVQDFVRSGEWSEVGDAANAGLRKFNSVFNSSELKALQDAGVELPAHGYLTGKQVQELHNMITPENKRFVYDDFGNIIDDPYSRAAREQNNFAGGGLVGLEAKYYLNNNSRPEEFASGGLVEYNPAEIENAVARLREDMYA